MPDLEIIVMVGVPCSGKSAWANKHWDYYNVVNNDRFARLFGVNYDARLFPYLRVMEGAYIRASIVGQGRSVIADSTNVTRRSRERYISLAEELGVRCIAVYKEVLLGEVLEWNSARERNKRLPEQVIRNMFQRLEIPSVDEGFQRVIISSTLRSRCAGLLSCESY